MKHLILFTYLKEHLRSVSVEISDCRTRSIFKNLFGCRTSRHKNVNISAAVSSPWTLNVTLLKEELGKITYFSTEVSFAAMINKLNEMTRLMLSANITENQISNLARGFLIISTSITENYNKFCFRPITTSDIFTHLNRLSKPKATRLDNISVCWYCFRPVMRSI